MWCFVSLLHEIFALLGPALLPALSLLPALLLLYLSVICLLACTSMLLLTVSILPTFPESLSLSLSLAVNHVVFACPLLSLSLLTLMAFYQHLCAFLGLFTFTSVKQGYTLLFLAVKQLKWKRQWKETKKKEETRKEHAHVPFVACSGHNFSLNKNCNPGNFSKLINLVNWRFWHFISY